MKTSPTRALMWGTAVFVTTLGAPAPPALAAPINYGDFSGASVMYLDVTETATTSGDAEPLYGAPAVTGDQLRFTHTVGFNAEASGGGTDLTDGQLNFTVMGLGGAALKTLSIDEGGDYTLAGTGTAVTQIAYGLSFGSIVVLEVDGVALGTPVALGGASASGGDNLGAGVDLATPWGLSLAYDVDAALAAAGVGFTSGATKLEIALNNVLFAASEASTSGFVAKKRFLINATVPEPSGLALLGLALLGGLGARRSA